MRAVGCKHRAQPNNHGTAENCGVFIFIFLFSLAVMYDRVCCCCCCCCCCALVMCAFLDRFDNRDHHEGPSYLVNPANDTTKHGFGRLFTVHALGHLLLVRPVLPSVNESSVASTCLHAHHLGRGLCPHRCLACSHFSSSPVVAFYGLAREVRPTLRWCSTLMTFK